MTFQFWILYCSTLFLASLVPGPSMLLALNHGMRYGAKRTMVTASGNVLASLIQASVSLAGLGALLLTSQTLFLTIKWLGALYLIYIGVQTFRASSMVVDKSKDDTEVTTKSHYKMFLEAFFVAMGNPKAILFFSALFPQLLDMNTLSISQFLGAMVTLAIIAFLCFMIYAIGGERVISLFRKSSFGTIINRVLGSTFVGSGLAILVKK